VFFDVCGYMFVAAVVVVQDIILIHAGFAITFCCSTFQRKYSFFVCDIQVIFPTCAWLLLLLLVVVVSF